MKLSYELFSKWVKLNYRALLLHEEALCNNFHIFKKNQRVNVKFIMKTKKCLHESRT